MKSNGQSRLLDFIWKPLFGLTMLVLFSLSCLLSELPRWSDAGNAGSVPGEGIKSPQAVMQLSPEPERLSVCTATEAQHTMETPQATRLDTGR